MALTATVSGVKQVQRALRNVERKARRLNLYNATRMVADEAKRLAPRDTGRLRRSIRIQGRGKVGSRVRYAPYVHWGTQRVSDGKGRALSVYNEEQRAGRGAGAKAARAQGGQPFIYDAIDRRTHDIMSDLAEQIDRQARKEGLKQLRRGAVGIRRGLR